MTEADTPVVALGDMLLLRNPSNRELADAIGIHQPLERVVYDLVVVGAGPAGLAAAVYGASEGLRTVLLERTAPGGQAGSSMRIENYLGFPTGLTGSELADRAILQANKFGARLSVPTQVVGLGWENGYAILRLDADEMVSTKCVLVATGADYRRLTVEGCEQFEGKGVYYAATPAEGQMCQGSQVIVVGGGNSAGQAAVFLAQHARTVLLVIRGDDLYKSMSSYLAHRIEHTANIELSTNTVIRRLRGNGHLRVADIANERTGQARSVETAAVFSFIGAVPRTEWLPAGDRAGCRGIHPDRRRARPVSPLDEPPAPVPAGDQPAGRLRGGRRPLGLGQARRLGRRRGLDGDPVRPRGAQGAVKERLHRARPRGHSSSTVTSLLCA